MKNQGNFTTEYAEAQQTHAKYQFCNKITDYGTSSLRSPSAKSKSVLLIAFGKRKLLCISHRVSGGTEKRWKENEVRAPRMPRIAKISIHELHQLDRARKAFSGSCSACPDGFSSHGLCSFQGKFPWNGLKFYIHAGFCRNRPNSGHTVPLLFFRELFPLRLFSSPGMIFFPFEPLRQMFSTPSLRHASNPSFDE